MTHRPRLALGAIAMTFTLSLVGVACGDSDETASSTTTEKSPLEPCADVYVAGTGAPEGPETIESRGEPEMKACEPDGSLQIIDEIEGSGTEVPAGATVTVQYSGVDAPTGTLFDSSWSRGESISFGLDEVIPGWTEGMVGMKAGGRRTLVIPADLAYGDSGPAPGQTLVFTIDLESVEGAAGASTDASTTTVVG